MLIAVQSLYYALFVIHFVMLMIVVLRKLRTPKILESKDFVTIIRPCSGVDPYFRETVTSGFKTGDWPCKFIFCVANQSDPAYAELKAIAKEYPLFPIEILSTEQEISFNPKLNNIAQAWTHIEGEYVLIVDSNVRFKENYLITMMGRWRKDVALLSSPPAGVEPGNFAASLEAGFLNSHQDFWQLAVDSLGHGFAQGKILFWRKKVLEEGGGFPALGLDLAEDVASTKLARRMGFRVKLLIQPISQPLGQRNLKSVWQRQVRWAKVRRFGFPLIYAAEILCFASTWWFFGIVSSVTGAISWQSFALCFLLWYFAEYVVVKLYRWPGKLQDILAWIARDVLLLPVWVAGYCGRGFEWQGHKMSSLDIKKLQKSDD